jgi:hypothetical protein
MAEVVAGIAMVGVEACPKLCADSAAHTATSKSEHLQNIYDGLDGSLRTHANNIANGAFCVGSSLPMCLRASC